MQYVYRSIKDARVSIHMQEQASESIFSFVSQYVQCSIK